MSDWQERITHDTAPATRVEHELRYQLAAPLIADSAVWVDLGCGNGIAAAAAIGATRPASAVMVDVSQSAVDSAAAALHGTPVRGLCADLTDLASLEQVGAHLEEHGGDQLVTAFEVLEHLETFLPLLEWSTDLARGAHATFLLSVPNDEFWAIQNPYHMTSWGPGAFEELRHLLPAEHTAVRQVALAGSGLCDWDCTLTEHRVAAVVGGPGTVTSHFLVAFGPRHAQLRAQALVRQSDVLAQRLWERQRESNMAISESRIAEAQREIEQQKRELRDREVWFTEWRAYIHELERELGRPLSGASEDEMPNATADEDASPDSSADANPTVAGEVAPTRDGPAAQAQSGAEST
ncbi:MAG: methyltransferase domain-containing protein [Solirubrobacteraceae bacterium]